MAGIFSWFRSLFTNKKDRGGLDDLFQPVDPDALARALNVDQLGRQAGSQEIPTSEATTLDATELSIVHEFEHDAQNTVKKATDKIIIYRRQIEKLDVQNDGDSVKSIGNRFRAESDGVLAHCRDALLPLIRIRSEIQAELSEFQQVNELRRQADYPDSRFLHISVLLLVFAVESVLNAFFFAQGSDFGLIGGWIIAMQYAGINLALAFLITMLWIRNIHHNSLFRKIFGWFGVAALICFVVLFNLFVGHFREIYASNPEDAQSQAVEAFRAAPFELLTAESYLLLAVGCIFALIAAIDGYRYDDPYPGFGRIARRLDAASENYLEEKQGIKDHLSDLTANSDEKLELIKEEVLRKQDELLDLSSMSDTIRSRCVLHLDLLQRTCNVVLRRYRDVNSNNRSTDSPSYFNDGYDLLRNIKENLPDTVDSSAVLSRKAEVSTILKKIEKQQVSIQEIHSETIERLDDAIRKLEYRS